LRVEGVPHRVAERLRPVRNHPWLSFAAGLAAFAAGFALRYAAGATLDAAPYITLFPAILVAALIGGLRVGLFVAVLSFFSGWYLFLPPAGSWEIRDGNTAATLIFFWVTVGIQLYVIEALNRAIDGLSSERDRVGVLFRELQHRVANNMSFVASLLRLQRKRVAARPEGALSVFDQAQARLETMARIHRRLYDPESADLPLTAYFQGLVKDILEASGAKNIVCAVEVAPAKFDLARLVTLSLLINEFVTNAVKHGLAGRDSGTVSVRLEHEAQNYVLAVQDNGKGMAAEPAASSASLGLTIIRSLAAQLGGEVSWSASGGTTARVAFPARLPPA
jgi:two-component sensor histidine kinase